MTTGDLVRNEIFSRVADEHPDVVESLDQQYWQPFYEKFKDADKSSFDDYFFPFGLIKDPNLKVKEPASIIGDLATFQDSFLDLKNGINLENHDKDVASSIRRLSEITPTSTYPFLMQLLHGLTMGAVTKADGIEVLNLLESFLVCRAVCGHEPTGLHAVFKRLWEDCEKNPTAEKVKIQIRERKTVIWPSTSDVQECVGTRALYGSSITSFVLKEWNASLGGDNPNTIPWIEHVLPEALSEDWKQAFSEEQHKQMKDCIANLLPLSQPMNQSLGNAPYAKKRQVYMEDSIFKAAREFANENETWGPKELKVRSDKLTKWIVQRWSN